MMHNGVLRTARLEVASRLPEIAPDLRKHPDAVLYALRDVVMANNVDPGLIGPLDWGRAERHVYANFGFDQMRQGLIEGEGYNAHFIDPRTRAQKTLGNPFTLWGSHRRAYPRNLVGMMISRRDEVKREFTEGSDAAHRWWPYARARYALQGKHLADSEIDSRNISDEGLSLDWALSGSSLAHFMQEHANFISNNRHRIHLGQRVRAGHDLVYLPLALAGINIKNMRTPGRLSLSALKVKVYQDNRTQQYRVKRFTETEGDNWNQVFYTGEDLDIATLKCPVHTAPLNDRIAPSNLKTAAHAAINMGADYGLFRF